MITYVDPNLIVLLFLLGFSILYAAVLAIDALIEHDSADRRPERSPKRP